MQTGDFLLFFTKIFIINQFFKVLSHVLYIFFAFLQQPEFWVGLKWWKIFFFKQQIFYSCQNFLVQRNLPKATSLSLSFYFFGHNATDACGQEKAWNGISKIEEVAEKYFPGVHIPPFEYDSVFKSPWASTIQAEKDHKVRSWSLLWRQETRMFYFRKRCQR